MVNIDTSKPINELNLEISKSIINAAKIAIPRSNGTKKKRIVPWWTSECSGAIKMRNKAFKSLKKIICFQNLINYKRRQAEVRKIIRNAKRDYWRKYCESLGRNTALDKVWNTIKKMSGKSREYFFPVLKEDDKIIVDSKSKAELLARVFTKIHSTENLNSKEKKGREITLQNHNEVLYNDEDNEDLININFSLIELNKALKNSSKSTPGNDQISYSMLSNLSEMSKKILLELYNKVWKEGILPDKWKEAIVIPICKPGKDPHSAESYRPIALTSCIGKIMEKMVNNRLIYYLELKEKIKSYQFGFRKGRSTIDSALCLEYEIRRAQINKESLIAIFLDIEKAYDMLWKEGLLIKIKQMGIRGRIYRWIKNFLTERNIKVKVGGVLSSRHQIENGTPQGSIISPMLFIIMINDIFNNIDKSFGVSLFADDGLIWKRGRNIEFVNRKLQEALHSVEAWALEWGFRISISKSKVVVFTNRKLNIITSLKLYENVIERIDQIKYLGFWFDKKLTWKTHVNKIVEKSKKILNIMRCLRGKEWGADRKALKTIYIGLIRSVFDYGCILYNSASNSLLKTIDRIQYQALRLCCGAMKSTPISALQVEMGEMPLELRRKQLAITYWANIKGHKESYPPYIMLQSCQEKEKKQINSFGWFIKNEIRDIGINHSLISPVIVLPVIPPWIIEIAEVDLSLLEKGKQLEKKEVENYIGNEYAEYIQIYTDASKMSNNNIGIAFIIPDLDIMRNKRLTDKLTVYTGELMAILMALEWVEETRERAVVICSDSSSALVSIVEQNSESRQDIIADINHLMFRIKSYGSLVKLVWVPAHIGVIGNELADNFAKNAAKKCIVDLKIKMSKNEVKILVKCILRINGRNSGIKEAMPDFIIASKEKLENIGNVAGIKKKKILYLD
ncbi:uncharacterized protein LOC111608691 [Xiphophorus maculatus]|uniref:Uncharacterized LOC111608691 n=1 Tax=Xiphophorus maculatus TaxID=8083 RepID=A0A3B5QWC7_XIPMA|nr:uncharacterized protein LOC111608691 [Xiphophorus maculatus]